MSLISKIGYFLFKKDFDELKSENQKLKSDLDAQVQSCERETNLRREAIIERNSLESEVLKKTQALKAEKERVQSLETKVSSLEERLKTESQKKDRNWQLVVQEREAKKSEIERLNQDHLLECESLQAQFYNERNSLLSELTSLKESYNSQSEVRISLERQNELNSLRNEELNSRISSINEQLESLKDERDKYLIDLKNSSNLLSQLQQEKEDLKSQINAIKDKVIILREKEQIITSLQNEVKNKQSEIQDFETRIQILNEKISALNGEKENIQLERDNFSQKINELESSLRAMSATSAHALETEQKLREAQIKIAELQEQLRRAPKPEDFVKLETKIKKLEAEKKSLQDKIEEMTNSEAKTREPEDSIEQDETELQNTNDGELPLSPPRKPRTISIRKPYAPRIIVPTRNVLTKDFPPIENDNIYAPTERLISEALNVRTNPNSLVTANSIFQDQSAEEIARLSRDLVEAHNRKEPYLICPCCYQNLKISSRTVGGFGNTREIQYFTHAVKNYPCELKRDPAYTSIEGNPTFDTDEKSIFEDFREQFFFALTSDVSKKKGVSDVEKASYVVSDVLPIMKRRFAHVQAKYHDYDLVFEFVSKNTNVSKVYDRDIFYLINHKQVFWIFGLDSVVDYNELKRHVAHDILFTNRRNVFVFDLEAQDATRLRGELVLKCNWLDVDNEWAFQIEKNGKNGILITLDEINFNGNECRPYRFDADAIYFERHPEAERPAKPDREKLISDIRAQYDYELARKAAIREMQATGNSVSAYEENGKWGFKYKNTVFIEPKFTDTPVFQYGYAIVRKGSKYGVIKRFGQEVLSPKYDYANILPNGEIIYTDGKNWHIFGILDSLSLYSSNNDLIINTISDDLDIYYLSLNPHLFENQQSNEYYFIKKQIFRKDDTGRWQLWYSHGTKIDDEPWDNFEITEQSTIIVTKNNRTSEFDIDGNLIFEQKFKSKEPLANGNFLVETFNNRWAISDSNDSLLSEEYIVIEKISEKYLRFQKNSKWGVISSEGKMIVVPEYNSINSFEENIFNATIRHPFREWEIMDGKISESGERIVNLIGRNSNGAEIVSSFNLYGVWYNGRIILPIEYDELRFGGDNRFIAKKGDKLGLLNLQKLQLLPFEFDSISLLESGNYETIKGTNRQLYNKQLQPINDEVVILQAGFKKIKQNGKWGILSPDGNNDVDCHYDEISTFRGRLIGIINGELVKLNAYYPYRLMMCGKNIDSYPKDLVEIAGVKFQINPPRSNRKKNENVEVTLVNVTKTMKFPTVVLYNKAKAAKLAKHIDKPEDFNIGEVVTATITAIIFNKGRRKNVLKNIDVLTTDNRVSHVFNANLNSSKIDMSTLKKGDKLILTKINYNEELDRTNWSVSNFE